VKDLSKVTKIPKAQSNAAVLVVDMISDFDFDGGNKLFDQAVKVAENISDLKSRATSSGVPVIYVNDNFGKWNEDFGTYVENTMNRSRKGQAIGEILKPEKNDLFILKPQRSGFYATALGVLLLSMDVSKIIITGVTTDICVLFTAHDAYMRGYHVQVPSDCSAAVETEDHDHALNFLKRVADANINPSGEIEFEVMDKERNWGSGPHNGLQSVRRRERRPLGGISR
jgi:nicotinamidase-related amidase